ncbi:hypothetical protein ACOSP7_032160 [Xanthoceras sorbifolium]
MSLSPLCCRSHKEFESVTHALWGCDALKKLREDCSFLGRLPNVIHGSLLEFLLFCRVFLDDFATAREVRSPVRVDRFVRWIAPITGELKLYTDAALDLSWGNTGFGVVLRNHCGEVMLSGLVSFDGVLKLDDAEAKAILFGVSVALEGGFS